MRRRMLDHPMQILHAHPEVRAVCNLADRSMIGLLQAGCGALLHGNWQWARKLASMALRSPRSPELQMRSSTWSYPQHQQNNQQKSSAWQSTQWRSWPQHHQVCLQVIAPQQGNHIEMSLMFQSIPMRACWPARSARPYLSSYGCRLTSSELAGSWIHQCRRRRGQHTWSSPQPQLRTCKGWTPLCH